MFPGSDGLGAGSAGAHRYGGSDTASSTEKPTPAQSNRARSATIIVAFALGDEELLVPVHVPSWETRWFDAQIRARVVAVIADGGRA